MLHDEAADLDRILEGMTELPVKVRTSDSRSAFTNTKRIEKVLGESELEAFIAVAPETLPYFSGYYNLDLQLIREHMHIAVWPRQGDPVLICRHLGPGRQPIDSFVQDVRVYRGKVTSIDLLADLILERGWEKSRLGLEKDYFPVGRYEELAQKVPTVSFENCQSLIDEIRMIKTPAEIELFRFAARATEKAIIGAFEMARPGDTEKSVADLLGYFITKLGADTVAFNVVASGPRAVLGHHYAEYEPLMEGDLLRVDYGGLFSGYYTDVVRMAVVGKPSVRQLSTYQKVIEIHRGMLEEMRPGASLRELAARALRQYHALQLPPTRGFFGHSIGLSVHEEPSITIDEARQLQANMVLCVEHGWADETSKERYHIEDMIRITEDDYELLTNYSPIDEMYEIR